MQKLPLLFLVQMLAHRPPLYLIGTFHRQPLIFCAIYTNTLQKLVVEIDSIMDTTLLMLCTERQNKVNWRNTIYRPKETTFFLRRKKNYYKKTSFWSLFHHFDLDITLLNYTIVIQLFIIFTFKIVIIVIIVIILKTASYWQYFLVRKCWLWLTILQEFCFDSYKGHSNNTWHSRGGGGVI